MTLSPPLSKTLQPPPAVKPRWATPRPTGPTFGPAISKIMSLSGTPSMPWQDYAADIIGEIDPDTGLRRWPLVIISVPRQAGKTRLMGGAAIQRAIQSEKACVWSTAQTGQHARRNWLKFSDDVVADRFPLSKLFDRKKSRGDERLEIPRTGSFWSPHPPTEDSLHGEQGDMNFIDEAWAFDEAQGAALMQAITPTHSTRPGAQTILISTRGTAASTWFHNMIEKAKSGEPGIALIDYGITDDVDPSDLEAVAAAHPAIGHTQSIQSLKSAWEEMGGAVNEFARAFGNRQTAAAARLIPLEALEMARTTVPIPDEAHVSFGVAVNVERSQTAIFAAAVVDGVPIVEAVDIRPGTYWAADRLDQLTRSHGGSVMIDAVGPSGALATELKRIGTPIYEISSRELSAACADVYDRLTRTDEDGSLYQPDLRIRPDGAIDAAFELLGQRRMGDAWVWNRRIPSGSIAPVEALTLALHGALNVGVQQKPAFL